MAKDQQAILFASKFLVFPMLVSASVLQLDKTDCEISLEIFYLQDMTMPQNTESVPSFLSSFVDRVRSAYSESYFGFGTFKDKPTEGDAGGYCFLRESRINPSAENLLKLVGLAFQKPQKKRVRKIPTAHDAEAYYLSESRGAQLDAMIRATLAGGFTSVGRLSVSRRPILRLLLVSTDSFPQNRGDVAHALEKHLKRTARKTPESSRKPTDKQMPADSHEYQMSSPIEEQSRESIAVSRESIAVPRVASFDSVLQRELELQLNENVACASTDYPSRRQLSAVLETYAVHPVFMLPPNATAVGARRRKVQQGAGATALRPIRTDNELFAQYQQLVVGSKLSGVVSIVDGLDAAVDVVDKAVHRWKGATCSSAFEAYGGIRPEDLPAGNARVPTESTAALSRRTKIEGSKERREKTGEPILGGARFSLEGQQKIHSPPIDDSPDSARERNVETECPSSNDDMSCHDKSWKGVVSTKREDSRSRLSRPVPRLTATTTVFSQTKATIPTSGAAPQTVSPNSSASQTAQGVSRNYTLLCLGSFAAAAALLLLIGCRVNPSKTTPAYPCQIESITEATSNLVRDVNQVVSPTVYA